MGKVYRFLAVLQNTRKVLFAIEKSYDKAGFIALQPCIYSPALTDGRRRFLHKKRPSEGRSEGLFVQGFVHKPLRILFLFDGSDRALAGTGTAADAVVCINLELAIAEADCAYRALGLASTTCYTGIANTKCHNHILLLLVCAKTAASVASLGFQSL